METCQACRGHGYLPPERECANEKCRKLFRWQEGRSATGRARVDAIYCSRNCASAQAERRRRARQIEKIVSPEPPLKEEPTPPRLLLAVWPDAAKALGGIGRTKMFDLIKSGDLRTVTIGRRRFVPASAIGDYVAKLEAAQV